MKDPRPRILDLGCGTNKQPGALGVDLHGKDVMLHDLEEFPWPLPDNHFTVVYMVQSLEHLSNGPRTMQELYRICQHGALIFIQLPNGMCPGFIQDPDHKTPYNLGTFLYYCPEQWPGNWDERQWDYGTNFRVLFYHTTGERSGRTPWGDTLFADNLTVILQVIKEDK